MKIPYNLLEEAFREWAVALPPDPARELFIQIRTLLAAYTINSADVRTVTLGDEVIQQLLDHMRKAGLKDSQSYAELQKTMEITK